MSLASVWNLSKPSMSEKKARTPFSSRGDASMRSTWRVSSSMTPSSTIWRPSPRSIPVTYTLRVTRALRFVFVFVAVTKIAHRGEQNPLDNTSGNR